MVTARWLFVLFVIISFSVGRCSEIDLSVQSSRSQSVPKCPPICFPRYLYGENIAAGLCSIDMFKDACRVRPCVAYDGETQGFACEEIDSSSRPSTVPLPELPPTPITVPVPSSVEGPEGTGDDDEEEEGDEVLDATPVAITQMPDEPDASPLPSEPIFTPETLPSVTLMPMVPSPSLTSTPSPSLTFLESAPSVVPIPPVRESPAPARPTVAPDSIPFVIFTDPHIRTFDGLYYDCQASGEFTLVRAAGIGLNIQARFGGQSTRGTVTKAIVAQQLNSSTVQVSIPSASTSSSTEIASCPVALFVNGSASQFDADTSSAGVAIFREDASVTLDLLQSNVRIEFSIATSQTFGCYLESLTIYIPTSLARSTSITGLAGSPNNDFTDDWMSPTGNIISLPNDTNSRLFGDAYNYCTMNWCIRNTANSLFTYEDNESHSTFDKCSIPYGSEPDFNNSAPSNVRNLCGTNIQCLIDGTVGGITDAQRCLQAQAQAEEVTNEMAVFKFEPSLVAVGVSVNVFITVDTTKLAVSLPSGLERYDIFAIDPITGETLGASIIPLEDNGSAEFSDAVANDGVFSNLLAVESDVAGTVLGYRAVPVISGVQEFNSQFAVTELAAITFFSAQSGIGVQNSTNSSTNSSGNDGTLLVENADFEQYSLKLRYSWGASQTDLDTGTEFLEEKVGFSCQISAEYLDWTTGDNTGSNGFESVEVNLSEAKVQGLWVNNTSVVANAGWFSSGSEGPATLRVFLINSISKTEIAGSELSTVISPGAQSGCASKLVATIFITVGSEQTAVRLVKAP